MLDVIFSNIGTTIEIHQVSDACIHHIILKGFVFFVHCCILTPMILACCIVYTYFNMHRLQHKFERPKHKKNYIKTVWRRKLSLGAGSLQCSHVYQCLSFTLEVWNSWYVLRYSGTALNSDVKGDNSPISISLHVKQAFKPGASLLKLVIWLKWCRIKESS